MWISEGGPCQEASLTWYHPPPLDRAWRIMTTSGTAGKEALSQPLLQTLVPVCQLRRSVGVSAQTAKRSLKSSLPNSRSSLHISKSEKDIARNSEFSTTPTSELSTKLSTQDSDSDDNSGSISSSVRSSISSRYGRRSSVPETQVLARLSEDEDRPEKPARTTIPSNASGAVSVRQHSTNSLPRLGTSAIQKSKSTSSTMITSVAPSQPR